METAPMSAASSSGLSSGLRIVSAVVAVGVVIQAWLGSSGFFQGEPGRIDLHGYIANAFFLVVVVQAVLVFLLMQKGLLGRNALIVAGITILLTFAQIGLGYSTRESVDALAWHIPVGVALMGTSAVLMSMAWNAPHTPRD